MGKNNNYIEINTQCGFINKFYLISLSFEKIQVQWERGKYFMEITLPSKCTGCRIINSLKEIEHLAYLQNEMNCAHCGRSGVNVIRTVFISGRSFILSIWRMFFTTRIFNNLLVAVYILCHTLRGVKFLASHFFSSEPIWTPKTQPNNSRAVLWLSFWCSTRPSADTVTN